MESTVINIKTDPKVKIQAKRIASSLGFSLSSLINGYLNQLVRTKTVHFNLTDEEPNEYMTQSLREAEEERRKGKFKSFAATDEALEFIDRLIYEGKKH